MQYFELSVEKSRIPQFWVFKNRNVKYHKILYVFHNKPSKNMVLNFKLCRRGDLYTTLVLSPSPSNSFRLPQEEEEESAP